MTMTILIIFNQNKKLKKFENKLKLEKIYLDKNEINKLLITEYTRFNNI